MANQPQTVEATCWLTIEPKFRDWVKDERDRPILDSARVTGMTQKRPDKRTRTGTVLTKITLKIDAEALLPLVPSAVVHIHPGDVEIIEVTADAPGEES